MMREIKSDVYSRFMDMRMRYRSSIFIGQMNALINLAN